MIWILLAVLVLAVVGYWGMHRAATRRPTNEELTEGIDLTPYISTSRPIPRCSSLQWMTSLRRSRHPMWPWLNSKACG